MAALRSLRSRSPARNGAGLLGGTARRLGWPKLGSDLNGTAVCQLLQRPLRAGGRPLWTDPQAKPPGRTLAGYWNGAVRQTSRLSAVGALRVATPRSVSQGKVYQRFPCLSVWPGRGRTADLPLSGPGNPGNRSPRLGTGFVGPWRRSSPCVPVVVRLSSGCPW
jgi:hypothetical protein